MGVQPAIEDCGVAGARTQERSGKAVSYPRGNEGRPRTPVAGAPSVDPPPLRRIGGLAAHRRTGGSWGDRTRSPPRRQTLSPGAYSALAAAGRFFFSSDSARCSPPFFFHGTPICRQADQRQWRDPPKCCARPLSQNRFPVGVNLTNSAARPPDRVPSPCLLICGLRYRYSRVLGGHGGGTACEARLS